MYVYLTYRKSKFDLCFYTKTEKERNYIDINNNILMTHGFHINYLLTYEKNIKRVLDWNNFV